MRELPCIVCEKPSRPAIKDSETVNQPYGATAFFTHGHYGSTVFDPMTEQYLEITVCDECLAAAGRGGKVYLMTPARQVQPDVQTWNPNQEEEEE